MQNIWKEKQNKTETYNDYNKNKIKLKRINNVR